MATDDSGLKQKVPAKPRLLIVDGHAYAYRAFFAIRGLTSPTGKATNAIYGFIRMLGKALTQVGATHVIVIWDGGLAAERTVLLPEYKAQRPSMPTDLEQQLDEIVAYLGAANVTSMMEEGEEADDLIAVLTHRAVAADFEVVIASSDKDFMQLISPKVRLLNPNDKSEQLMGETEVKAKTGVNSTQIVDWLSLIGDSVDNIPGARGIGPKTAADLLSQFGSLDAIYTRLAEVTSERVRSSLETSKEAVRRNQKLVHLNSEVPCEAPLESLAVRPADEARLASLFAGWGFKRMLQELEQARAKTTDFFAEKAGAV